MEKWNITIKSDLDGYCPYSGRYESIYAEYNPRSNLGSLTGDVIVHRIDGCTHACPDLNACPVIHSRD